MTDLFITTFTTLFVIMDPIGVLPIFVALTNGMTARERFWISMRAAAVAAFILALFAFGGEAILHFFGIGIPAFRIAGGLLLFLIAVEMLFERRTERREKQADNMPRPDPSVFPLGTPLIAGPGAMAAMILIASQGEQSFEAHGVIFAAALAVLLVQVILFQTGSGLERILGQSGISVVTRLLGTLLAALAVQFVVDGLRGLGVLA